MRDLQRYANECVNDMRALGIDVPVIEKFTVNTRAKSRFGQCSYNSRTKTYKIDICSDLLDDECNVMALRETIFHELIHTLPNCMNHGSEFKRYADMINKAYLTNITRCSTSEEKYGYTYAKKVAERNKKPDRQIKPRVQYELWCDHCGKIRASGLYKNMPKWYRHSENYHCGVCGGNLERVGISHNITTYTF